MNESQRGGFLSRAYYEYGYDTPPDLTEERINVLIERLKGGGQSFNQSINFLSKPLSKPKKRITVYGEFRLVRV